MPSLKEVLTRLRLAVAAMALPGIALKVQTVLTPYSVALRQPVAVAVEHFKTEQRSQAIAVVRVAVVVVEMFH
jgi:hypothetical protein